MVNDMKNDVEKKEYIERSEVENAIRALYPSMSTPDGSGENDDLILAAQEMCADAIKAVRDVPTADVEPVVHAKWKSVYGTHRPRVACTNCKYDVKSQLKYYKRCPNCGAKMDRGK